MVNPIYCSINVSICAKCGLMFRVGNDPNYCRQHSEIVTYDPNDDYIESILA